MNQNLLPAIDLFEEAAAPVETDKDALGLHALLQRAFASEDDGPPKDYAPSTSAIDTAQTFAAAMLRQSQAFEKLQDRATRLENGSDLGGVRENVRGLCEALLQITEQTKNASAEVEERFESLSNMMAALSGHMASQRQDLQTNIAATTQLSQQLKQLQDEIAGQRAEAAQLKDLMLGQPLHKAPDVASLANRIEDMETSIAALTGHVGELESDTASLADCVTDLEPLKGSVARLAAEDAKLVERIGLVSDDLEATRSQVTGLEDAAAALADSSIRTSEGLSVLGNALEAAKTQIFSLNQTSEYLTERLRIAELVVEESSRREKILADLHASAARTLQSGQ